MSEFQAENGLVSGYSFLVKGFPREGNEDDLKARVWQHFDKFLEKAKAEGKIQSDGKVADIQFNVSSKAYLEKELFLAEKNISAQNLLLENFLRVWLKREEENFSSHLENLQKLEKMKENPEKQLAFNSIKGKISKRKARKLHSMVKKQEGFAARLGKLKKRLETPEVQEKKVVNFNTKVLHDSLVAF